MFSIVVINMAKCKVSNKKGKKLVEFSTTEGGGSGWVDFPLRKKKNAKMIRMVHFIQKNEDLHFLLLVGQVKFSG